MRYFGLAPLFMAPAAFSLPITPPLPLSPDSGSIVLLLVGFVGLVVIRWRQQ